MSYDGNFELQWGHDKIVMEVIVPPASSWWQIPLQWGHDKIVMEVKNSGFTTPSRPRFNGAMTK